MPSLCNFSVSRKPKSEGSLLGTLSSRFPIFRLFPCSTMVYLRSLPRAPILFQLNPVKTSHFPVYPSPQRVLSRVLAFGPPLMMSTWSTLCDFGARSGSRSALALFSPASFCWVGRTMCQMTCTAPLHCIEQGNPDRAKVAREYLCSLFYINYQAPVTFAQTTISRSAL